MRHEVWQSPRLATIMAVLAGGGVAVAASILVTLFVRGRPIPGFELLQIAMIPLLAGGVIVTYIWTMHVYGELWPFTVRGGRVGALLLVLFLIGMIAATTAMFQLLNGESLNAEDLEQTSALKQQLRTSVYMGLLSWVTGNALFAGPSRQDADVAT